MPPRPSITALVIPFLLLAASAGDARAQARETAVVDVSSEGKAAAEIAHTIREAVRAHDGYVLKDIHGVLNAGGEADAQGNIKTAQAFHKAGLSALEGGDAMDAAEQFETAAQLMENSFAQLRDTDEYRRVLLHLGMALFRSGEAAPAGLAFERAVLFQAEPGMVDLSADERALLDKAREAIEARSLGAVMLESEPSHAEVYVDGRYRGVTPLTVAGLPEGKHVVTAFKSGFVRQTARVEISSLGMVNRTVALEPARRKRLFDEMRGELRSGLDALDEGVERGGEGVRRMGALLFAEAGVVVQTTGESPRHVSMYLFDTNSRLLVHRVEGDVDWSRRNREQVRDLVSQLLDVDWDVALAGVPEDPAGPAAEPITKKWWFWTAIGVGVAGATAAALIATSGGDGGEPPDTGALVLTF
ncbi:MAG: PEGA domain-containing protein [Myxococcota bacterium]